MSYSQECPPIGFLYNMVIFMTHAQYNILYFSYIHFCILSALCRARARVSCVLDIFRNLFTGLLSIDFTV